MTFQVHLLSSIVDNKAKKCSMVLYEYNVKAIFPEKLKPKLKINKGCFKIHARFENCVICAVICYQTVHGYKKWRATQKNNTIYRTNKMWLLI